MEATSDQAAGQRSARNGRSRLLPLTPAQFAAKRDAWLQLSREALPRLAKSYTLIGLGCLIMAAGYSFFMIPQKIAPGGVYGIATILHYATGELLGRALPTGALGLLLNIPLFLWG